MEKVIIILDDDSVVNLINEKLLIEHYPGHKILVFEDPDKALEYFTQLDKKIIESVDFTLFLDVDMPSLTGFEFLEELEIIQDRLEESNSEFNIKVHLLTTDNSVYSKEKVKVFPMIKEFIIKPLTAESIPV